MSFNNCLDSLQRKLAAIQGVKSCSIGVEANLSPKDYPLIRLQPNGFRRSDKAAHYRICDLFIYFGLPLTEGKDGISTIYSKLLDMETSIIDQSRIGESYRSTYIKTIVSDSQVEHYKLMVVVLEVEFEA